MSTKSPTQDISTAKPRATSIPSQKFDYGLVSFILVLILIFLILLAVFCAAGYFYYLKKQQKLKPKLSVDVESGRGSSQPMRLPSNLKQHSDRPRRSSNYRSPSSQSPTEGSSDESSPVCTKAKVTQSEAYPTKVISNINGDKEIKIKGLPTGSLVFVVRNKRSRSSSSPVKKRFPSMKVVQNTSVKKEKSSSIPITATPSSVISKNTSSVNLSTKTPPMKSPPTSPSTVSFTLAKKTKKQLSEPKNLINTPKQPKFSSQSSGTLTSSLIKPSGQNSSVSSSVPSLSKENLRSNDSENSSTSIVPSISSLQEISDVSQSDFNHRDIKVSPDNWSFKSAFTSLPLVLKEPAEGERDIKRTRTTWKTNINGNPVEGRTHKYSSRRVSMAHPKQMAQPLSLNGLAPISKRATKNNRERKFFGLDSPPLSLSEKNTQSASPVFSPDLVDKTQSSSSPNTSDEELDHNPYSKMKNATSRQINYP